MRRLPLAAAGRGGRREMRRLMGRRPSRRASARRLPLAAAYAACALLLLVGVALGRVDLAPAPLDTAPAGAVRVVDGDTLDVAGERIRIADIDTPEMPPKSGCAAEADGALRARDQLQALVSAGPVALERTGTDRYGRTLAHVAVNGADAGDALVAAGLARRWEGRRRSWCA